MIRKFYIWMGVLISCLYCISFVFNYKKYKQDHSWLFCSVKSLIDTAIGLCSTVWMTPVAIALSVDCILSKVFSSIKPGIRRILSIIISIAFGSISLIVAEVVAVFSVIGADQVTGYDGFLGHYNEEKYKYIQKSI